MERPTSTPTTPPSDATQPTRCPACQSPAIVTTAKNPDVDSYWRCTACGEVWNAARSKDSRHGGRFR
jgi:predicted Zn finger-like uncharacterized protein